MTLELGVVGARLRRLVSFSHTDLHFRLYDITFGTFRAVCNMHAFEYILRN